VDPNPDTAELEAVEGFEEAGSFLADISSSIPGIDEAMSFAEVMKQVQSFDYGCIVFDTAPTGHTLRLLQFPSTLEKGLSKLASLRDSFGGLLGGLGGMLGGAGAQEMADQMLGKLDQLKVRGCILVLFVSFFMCCAVLCCAVLCCAVLF
jgi:arsenite/tail-anchored protein-transporting ATPase